MTTTDTAPIDRTGWGPGAWDAEPDRDEWHDEATGLPCLVVRNKLGALCGYVGAPPGHPWHRLPGSSDALEDVDVHGGVTFANSCHPPICHTPAPGEPDDVWWIGFDCAHCGDPSACTTRRGDRSARRAARSVRRAAREGAADLLRVSARRQLVPRLGRRDPRRTRRHREGPGWRMTTTARPPHDVVACNAALETLLAKHNALRAAVERFVRIAEDQEGFGWYEVERLKAALEGQELIAAMLDPAPIDDDGEP